MHQAELFGAQPCKEVISLESVFRAYFACRKNKRRTKSALRFEMNLEENLVTLWRDLNAGRYQIGLSNAFVVTRPVLREIFAAGFRDRIVHHLIIERLLPLLEASFSPVSYSCRKGKGTLYGIRSVYKQLQACSNNFTRDCYVLRLDIRAFFLNIPHHRLFKRLDALIAENYHGADKTVLRALVRQIVFHRPQDLCRRRGSAAQWERLPAGKSLFQGRVGFGLPIGNLTSQLFANFYLNAFDRFVRQQRGLFYGRYVDDLVLMHQNRLFLKRFKCRVARFLKEQDGLTLHPRKIVLTHYAKGFSFIGAFIKPHRLYVGRRLKTCFLKACISAAGQAKDNPAHWMSVINSYFGFLKHYASFHLRQKGKRILSGAKAVLRCDAALLKVVSFRRDMPSWNVSSCVISG